MNARLIQVIETKRLDGVGSEGDPIREVTEYWSEKGVLLATDDPLAVRIEPGHPDWQSLYDERRRAMVGS